MDDYLKKIINKLWQLPRDLISDGYDVALETLSFDAPVRIHEYPSGSECFTWVVPDKWTCADAYLETLNGKRIFSYSDNPLHVVSYSQPFSGVVSREELFDHLHVHPRIKDAIPFQFFYYKSNWGLCCSQNMRNDLVEEAYRVVINSRFEPGFLKVGEVVVPGRSDKSIVICAHLCHPAQVNDDLSGVAVGMDIIRRLLSRDNCAYTYRLILLPETIGSAAYLSHNRELAKSFVAGIFLEMLGTDHPHSFQRSLVGNSDIDVLAEMIMMEEDSNSWSADFLQVILNDERMFNSAGINVPMVSLSRVLPKSHPEYPFREYHTSLDSPDRVNWSNLEASRDLVLRIIDSLEKNKIPQLLYEGELFCSRYPTIKYREMRDYIHKIPYYIDGKRSILDIAKLTGLGFSGITSFLEILEQEKLVKFL